MRPVTTPLPLLPHPQSPLIPVLLTVECRLEVRELVLHYRLRGDPRAVRWPPAGDGGRADGLWKHTCFEAFVANAHGTGYHEFNFAPSGAWAHYAFRAERERAADPDSAPPLIDRLEHADGVDLIAVIDRRALPPLPWRLGLSAVLEDPQGRLAHCALHHPRPQPDFHDRAGWTLRLPAA